ncbi:MAG: Flp family type IVb pilin [Acidobacteria bacterium]|nr:Flp family type IVb pilin [Acidobacteriota bacterium]
MTAVRRVRRILRDERGQDLIEYGLLASLIAVVVSGAVQILGRGVSDLWTRIVTDLVLYFS